jgi:hypothetical protein
MGRKPKSLSTNDIVITETTLTESEIDVSKAYGLPEGFPPIVFGIALPPILSLISELSTISLTPNTDDKSVFDDTKKSLTDHCSEVAENVKKTKQIPYGLPNQPYLIAGTLRHLEVPKNSKNDYFMLSDLAKQMPINSYTLTTPEQVAFFVVSTHKATYLNKAEGEVPVRRYQPADPALYNIGTFNPMGKDQTLEYPEVKNKEFDLVLFNPAPTYKSDLQMTLKTPITVKGSWSTVKDITEELETTEAAS